jgi:hypothetical protein
MSTLNVNKIADASGGVLAPISSVMRNRIINGAMVIDQRNAGASVTPTNGSYTLDRWQIGASQASKFTVQQNAGSVTPPVGFTNYLGCTSSSAYTVGAAEAFRINQTIEGFNIADLGWGTANAKTVTVSAWVRSSLTGTFGGAIYDVNAAYSYPFSYSIPVANTWTQISVTVVGATSGTWGTGNSNGLTLTFSLGAGTTRSGTAGAWASAFYTSATGATSVVGTNGATFYITGVQLEVGTQATSFEYRQYQQEFALCQRYYQRVSGFYATGFNTTTLSNSIAFPQMRSSPTISASGALEISDFFTANYTQSSGNATISGAGSRVSSNGVSADLANFTGITPGRMYGNLPQINNLVLSAEL